jgi:hypothetical protein
MKVEKRIIKLDCQERNELSFCLTRGIKFPPSFPGHQLSSSRAHQILSQIIISIKSAIITPINWPISIGEPFWKAALLQKSSLLQIVQF